MAIDRETSVPEEWGVTIEEMEEGSCRIPFVKPEEVPEELRDELTPHYENSLENWGSVPRFLQMLGHSPPAVEAWMLLDRQLRMAYLQSDPDYVRIQQLVIVKTAIMNRSINCTAHNVDLGRSVGLTWEQLDLLVDDSWKDSDLFSEKERAAIGWAEALTNQTAYDDEAAFRAMEKHFPTRKIVELTFLCGMWNLSGRLTEGLHLMVEPPEGRIGFDTEGDGQQRGGCCL